MAKAESNRLILTLGKKFLLSKTTDGFVSLISGVSVAGVALGVLALTVVMSVINGFEGELIRVITGMNGDVILYSRTEALSDPGKIINQIRKVAPEATDISPGFVGELMVSGPDGEAGAVIEGVDPEQISKVTLIPSRVVEGRFPEKDGEIAIGYALAERIGASLTEKKLEGSAEVQPATTELRLIAPFVGPQGSAKSFNVKVVGIIRMGMNDYDSKFIFTTLSTVQKYLEQPGKVTSFKIRIKDPSQSREISNRLTESFGYPFRAKDWGQLNSNLLSAVQLEKTVISIILTVIVIVAAFNVVSTLMMMIHDKTKEIAILKAMGFPPSKSFRLFCAIGLGIGSVGILIGVWMGIAGSFILQKTHWIDLPPDIYHIGYLPVVIRWQEVGMICAVALLITFLATLYPSFSVSKRSPLDGIRYE
ncbi:MAG: ABC transporter permease [Bdellovibrionales bacterium]|nr:ABC transporter permease [Bdellovibrionales bacterium]